jgi:hypothetical protein
LVAVEDFVEEPSPLIVNPLSICLHVPNLLIRASARDAGEKRPELPRVARARADVRKSPTVSGDVKIPGSRLSRST